MNTKTERTYTREADTAYRCAGAWCPGLSWKASDRPHPVTCSYGYEQDKPARSADNYVLVPFTD